MTSPSMEALITELYVFVLLGLVWWTWSGSNRRPLPCHGSALPTAPQAHCLMVSPIYHTVRVPRQLTGRFRAAYNEIMPFRRAPRSSCSVCLSLLDSRPAWRGGASSPARRQDHPDPAHRRPADAARTRIAQQYEAIHDFNATVDMVPALGTAEKSKITEYKDVRAYILFRKPADIRIIGLYPVVRNKAFDMVSNGTDFKLYVPARIASSSARTKSKHLRQTSSKTCGRSISWKP